MITAIIVDDEPKSRDVLKTLLNRFCGEVEILAQAGSIGEAKELIKQYNPELLSFVLHLPNNARHLQSHLLHLR